MIFRAGNRGTLDQRGDAQNTVHAVKTIQVHVCQPLEQLGYRLVIFADIICPQERIGEAQDCVSKHMVPSKHTT